MRRSDHQRAIDELIDELLTTPSVLLIEGEPGIGKTTVWSTAVAAARSRGITVLSTRAHEAESVAGYAGLGDLLGAVGNDVFTALPPPQQGAIDGVLVRSDSGAVTEPRTVAAAFLSVVTSLAAAGPVLIAIDDLQWVDPSTAFVLGFVTRRLPTGVGVVATRRTGEGAQEGLLQTADTRRITLQPLSLRETADVLEHRVQPRLSRSAVSRIWQISAGNPFYAIELGLAMARGASTDADLPPSLSALVEARVGELDPDVGEVLLAAAAVAAPTVDELTAAVGRTTEEVTSLLEEAEAAGIVVIDGNRIGFTHPLLAHGVYTGASPSVRRGMHRRLAAVMDHPERRARHLALGAMSADPETVDALDRAAELARNRGAPAAAAELLDLAIDLGADAPERRIRAAAHHFDSSGAERARTMLEGTITTVERGRVRAAAANLLSTILMTVDGFRSAATVLECYLPEAAADPGLSVTMLMSYAFALMNLGKKKGALRSAEEAVLRAERAGQPALLGRALGLRMMFGFMAGRGVDRADLRRSLRLDDGATTGPAVLQPRVQRALLRGWIGDLDTAVDELRAIQQRRLDDGDESESVFIAYHLGLLAIWRGEFDAAAGIAQGAIDSARYLEGDIATVTGLTIQSILHAFAGRVDDARACAEAGLDASTRTEGTELTGFLIAGLGFLEVSVGDHAAALKVLQPLVDVWLSDPDYSEIIVAWGVSDAVEAMVRQGQSSHAERLTAAIERNGARLDRPWMLAMGGRCRGMLLAASGDVAGAVAALESAMLHHDRVAMPFERARSQLILGGLRRRLRQRQIAATDLQTALLEFERLNTPLWAERARTELSRVTAPSRVTVLTATEQRVAALAAEGLTNRGIASALAISPKTVDVHLGKIYRKLGIHSRTELARWLSSQRR